MSAIATINPHALATPDPYLPTNIEQAMKLAELVARSDLAPKDYKGKPGNVFVAMQMGHELGLSPMQSIQNIAVINGRPSVWGDALLALCQSHPAFEDIQETDDGDTATCVIKRRGRSPVSRSFSMDDAKRAGLLGKQGPWSSYPARMRQMRARGFALRDAFADALRGLSSGEEQEDILRAEVVQPKDAIDNIRDGIKEREAEHEKSKVDAVKKKLAAKKAAKLDDVLRRIDEAASLDDLLHVAEDAKKLTGDDIAKARDAYAKRKADLEFAGEEPPHDENGVVTDEQQSTYDEAMARS